MKCKKIIELCNIVEEKCVRRLIAPNSEAVDRWSNDYLTWVREGYKIVELEPKYHSLVDEALNEWKAIQTINNGIFLDSCQYADKARQDNFWISMTFESWMLLVREKLINGTLKEAVDFGGDLSRFSSYFNSALTYKLVMNIDWCSTFGAYLPLAMPAREVEIAKHGAYITAVFYVESIGKYLQSLEWRSHGMQMLAELPSKWVDAYFLRALELSGESNPIL